MLKAVFFDLGDTLIHSPVQPLAMRGTTLASFLRREGIDALCDQQVTDLLAQQRQRENGQDGNCYGAWFRLERARLALCLQAAGVSLPEPILNAMTLRFRQFIAHRTRLFDDTLPTLACLREKGLAVHVISNNDGRTVAHVEHHGMTPWVDHVIDSAAIGVTKPDGRVFAYALDRAGVSADQAAMVGDSLTSDALGAADAGFRRAFWLNRSGKPACEDQRVTTIASLAELPGWLEA